jgi:hypothetical protein
MDNPAIVLYRTGNVKGWLFYYGAFSKRSAFCNGRNAVIWSKLFDASASQLRSAVTQAYAQRRPTVVSASAQCLCDPQRHGAIYRRK